MQGPGERCGDDELPGGVEHAGCDDRQGRLDDDSWGGTDPDLSGRELHGECLERLGWRDHLQLRERTVRAGERSDVQLERSG